MSDSNNKTNNKSEDKPIVIRNMTDLQRLKLEKLMKNPDKPIVIPERPKGRSMPSVPDFVRNVMGSSAGAGSGEFHVYRHLRRKEYARQKFIQEKSEKERLNVEYHEQIETNRKVLEDKTARKRAKRLKKKIKAKQRAKKPKIVKQSSSSESECEQSDEEKGDESNSDDNDNNSENIIVKEESNLDEYKQDDSQNKELIESFTKIEETKNESKTNDNNETQEQK